MASILDLLLEGGLRRTNIGHKLNLDSRAIGKYLHLLEELGLVARSPEDKSYFMSTTKGREYASQYSALIKTRDSLTTKSIDSTNT